jgi:UDP-galactopyranose mutase
MKNLVVGAGLSGAVIARLLVEAGEEVLVWEQTPVAGGCVRDHPINVECDSAKPHTDTVHLHGPHIFHTSEKWVWDFLSRFVEMKPTVFRSFTKHWGNFYPVPVNLQTISEIMTTMLMQDEAQPLILAPDDWAVNRVLQHRHNPDEELSNQTFEGVCRQRVGDLIYEAVFKHYTEAFWGCKANLIPGFIAERIPVRRNHDVRYHRAEDIYVGIPYPGYTALIHRLLEGINVDFDVRPWDTDLVRFKRVFFTGDPSYLLGKGSLPYRGFLIEHDQHDQCAYQQLIVNEPDNVTRSYCSRNLLVDRDHKGPTIVSTMRPIPRDLKESHPAAAYPLPWNRTAHDRMLAEVKDLIGDHIYFAGRKALHKYLDMDKAIMDAHRVVKEALEQ